MRRLHTSISASAPRSMQGVVPHTCTWAFLPTGKLEHRVEGGDLVDADVGHAQHVGDEAHGGLRQPAAVLLLRPPQQGDHGGGLLARRIFGDGRLAQAAFSGVKAKQAGRSGSSRRTASFGAFALRCVGGILIGADSALSRVLALAGRCGTRQIAAAGRVISAEPAAAAAARRRRAPAAGRFGPRRAGSRSRNMAQATPNTGMAHALVVAAISPRAAKGPPAAMQSMPTDGQRGQSHVPGAHGPAAAAREHAVGGEAEPQAEGRRPPG